MFRAQSQPCHPYTKTWGKGRNALAIAGGLGRLPGVRPRSSALVVGDFTGESWDHTGIWENNFMKHPQVYESGYTGYTLSSVDVSYGFVKGHLARNQAKGHWW